MLRLVFGIAKKFWRWVAVAQQQNLSKPSAVANLVLMPYYVMVVLLKEILVL
jgi:hypothetical protein